MAVSGFSLLLAAVSALAVLAAFALPAVAAEDPAAPAVAASRIARVPDAELSDRLRPAEMPPPDFTAHQYIDSAGCVFIRTDRGWLGRVARDGAPICGYPPTLSARRPDPDGAAALFAEPAEPQSARIHRELSEAIIPSLRAGELLEGGGEGQAGAADAASLPRHSGAAWPPAPVGIPPQAAPDGLGLGEMMATAPVLSRQMAPSVHIDRLCTLIGGTPKDAAGSTLGLCEGGTAIALAALARPVAEGGATTKRADPAAIRSDRNGSPRDDGRASPMKAAAAKPAADSRDRPVTGAARDDPRLIPPGARYVQVGAFRDPAGAENAARRLGALGLPVVRSRAAAGQSRLIMVGPLDGREAIVRMIDRLRRAGFRDLVARR